MALTLEDEQGVDEEVLPILLDLGATPNITFRVNDEEPTEITIDIGTLSASSSQLLLGKII